MPLPFDPNLLTDEAIAVILADLTARAGDIGQKLDLRDVDVSDADLLGANRDFGRMLSPMARAAGDTIANCEPVFRGVPCSAESIRGKEARVRLLQSSLEVLGHLHDRLGANLAAARVELAADVRTVLRTVEATEAHPATPRAVLDSVGGAARPLRALYQSRKDELRAAWSASRARNEESAGKLAEKTGEIDALRGDNARLQAENRYLSGEALRPADLEAARSTLSAPDRTSAPARARRGRGAAGGRPGRRGRR